MIDDNEAHIIEKIMATVIFGGLFSMQLDEQRRYGSQQH